MHLMNDTNNDQPQEKTMLDNAGLIRSLYDAVNKERPEDDR